MIEVRYSRDGLITHRTFTTLRSAQAFAHKRIGATPTIGRYYAIGDDGVGIIHVWGATLTELFPPREPYELLMAAE